MRKTSKTANRQLAAALDLKALSDDGSFEGYGAVFGNVDSYGEVVAKGAFKASLAEHRARGTLPAMLWQHDPRSPIGVYAEMREDSTGLYVKGQLALETERGSEAHVLLRMKALNGLSIGFVPSKWEWDEERGIRTLTQIDLWEVSLVTFPANPEARVSGVKAADIKTIREFEKFLRDEGGFSVEAAKRIAAGGYKALAARDEPGDLTETLAALRGLQRNLSA